MQRGQQEGQGTAAGVSTLGDAGGQRLRKERVKWLEASVLGKKG